MYRLSLEEQETIITWDRKNKRPSKYTTIPAEVSKLQKLAKEFPADYEIERQDSTSIDCLLPINSISVRMPRVLTEEQRKALSDRAKETFWKGAKTNE